MSDLNDIVNITITRETVVPTQNGFGFCNFVSPLSTFVPRIKSYANITEVSADTLLGTDAKDFASKYFGQQIRPTKLYVTKKSGGESYTDALDEAVDSDDGWYGTAIASILDADNLAVAEWIEARKKIFCAITNDAGAYDPDDEYDILTQLADLSYDRTFLFYHHQASSVQVHGAPFGLQFPKNPGSTNWSYKRFSGINASSLSSTQRSDLLAKKGNCFTTRNGFNVFENGQMVSGEWIDIIQGIDWLEARMQDNIWSAYVNNEKIPFTDDGITLVVAQIEEALQKGIERGIIAADPPYRISAPRAAEVSKTDKGNRTLPDIEFEATLQGAINKTIIRGRALL